MLFRSTTRDMGEAIAAEVSATVPTHRNLPLLGVEHAIVVPQTQGIRSTLKTNLKVVSKGHRFSSLHNQWMNCGPRRSKASHLFPVGSLLDLPRSIQ